MKFKRRDGITLIALVITIIVLLILAGVTIATLTGENGILTRASEASEKTKQANVEEQVKLAVAASIGEDGEINLDDLNNELKKIEGLTYNGNPISDNNKIESLPASVNVDGYNVKINSDGSIESNTNNNDAEISSIDIANELDKNKYYGAIVKGYDCENNEGINAWKIFYADEKNIYLIADNYIIYDYAPTELNASNGSASIGFGDLSKYLGSESITDSRIIKWLEYLNDYPKSTYNNIKKTAILLDTNIWNKFKGEKAEYAIGGPTLDLYVASYNETHPEKTIQYRSQDAGYELKYNTDENFSNSLSGLNTEESLYVINSDTLGANAMWIASPSNGGYQQNGLMYVKNSGVIDCNTYLAFDGGMPGIRPVVCLNSSVTLANNGDGTFTIK